MLFRSFDFRIEFQPLQTESIKSMGFERGTYSTSAVLKGAPDSQNENLNPN